MGLEEVPYRVRNYFLTPCEKWSLGRRPFKTGIHGLKPFGLGGPEKITNSRTISDRAVRGTLIQASHPTY